MKIALAICVAGFLIAVSLAITSHWTIAPYLGTSVVRLNRWTGAVEICKPDSGSSSMNCGEPR